MIGMGGFGQDPKMKKELDDANAKLAARKTADYQADPNIQISRQGIPQEGAVKRRFEGMRTQAGQRVNAGLTDNVNAIQRRFASQGMSGSGAQISTELKARDQAQHQIEDANVGIDQVEGQAAEQEASRLTGANVQLNTAQADMDFRNRVFAFERGSKLAELDLASRQQELDAVDNEFNKRMAMEMSQPKGGLISNLLGGIL